MLAKVPLDSWIGSGRTQRVCSPFGGKVWVGGGADAGQAALVWAQELWGDLIPPCAKDRPSDSPAADYRLGCVDLATAPPQPPPTPAT